jgi:hypothetical protein
MLPRADDEYRLQISALARSPRVLHALHSLLRIAPPALRLGLPQRGGACAISRQGGTYVLESALGAGPLFISLETTGVVAIADRMLGGDGRLALTPRTDLPQPAELGCTGYALARVLAAMESPYQLREVLSGPPPAPPHALHWPMCLDTELGQLPFSLVGHPRLLPAGPLPGALYIDDARAPELPLLPGDLVLTDAPLTQLPDGLTGPLVLRFPGLDSEALVELRGGMLALVAQRPAAAQPTGLELADRALSAADFCALAAGTLAWPIHGRDPVRLRVRGQELASGELIRARGAIGMRVRSVANSAAQQE